VSARKQLKSTFPDPVVQRNIDLDMVVLECYPREPSKIEWFLAQQAEHHNPVHLQILKSVSGISRILASTIIYEVGDINRFESVQKFASYARLVKCKAESAEESYGTKGNKKAQKYLQKLRKRMAKAKALSVLAHELGRYVCFMMKVSI
jgi:transposase